MDRTITLRGASVAILLAVPALLGVDSCDNDVDLGGDYDPCAGLACGEACTLCPPDDPSCVETAVLKLCQADGTCAATAAMCGAHDGGSAPLDGGPYDPCGGLACGDTCTLCPPDDPSCVETAVLKLCQPDGRCDAVTPMCGGALDGGAAYDPCAGRACGDRCTLCAPDDPACTETAVEKLCQPDGSCAPTVPSCA